MSIAKPKPKMIDNMIKDILKDLDKSDINIDDIKAILVPWIEEKLGVEKVVCDFSDGEIVEKVVEKEKEIIVEQKEKECCSICLDDMGENNICVLECKHKFHMNCIMKLHGAGTSYDNICPLCRQQYCEKMVGNSLRDVHNIVINLEEEDETARLIHTILHISDNMRGIVNDVISGVGENREDALRRILGLDDNRFATLMCILFEI